MRSTVGEKNSEYVAAESWPSEMIPSLIGLTASSPSVSSSSKYPFRGGSHSVKHRSSICLPVRRNSAGPTGSGPSLPCSTLTRLVWEKFKGLYESVWASALA